jgi:glycine betaine/proline transport system permease protein
MAGLKPAAGFGGTGLSRRFASPALWFLLIAALFAYRGSDGIVGAYPAQWVLDLGEPLDRLFKYLSNDLALGPVSLSDFTRAISTAIAYPLDFLVNWLTEGAYVPLPDGEELALSQLPWIGIALCLLILAWRLGGKGAVLLTGATLAFVLILGLWASTLATLVSVFFAVAISALLGILLGVLAARHERLSASLAPIYDAMQTVPVFSYLSIILVFFGFGAVTALIATIIFALAPMARTVELSLRALPQSVGDLAAVTGCTPMQRLFWVELPSARHGLLLGLNQVTMLSLSMVIIASIIGAGGLGNDVLRGLKSLRMTEALLAGFAISLIAIAIDRTLRAWTERSMIRAGGGASGKFAPLIALAFIAAITGLAYWIEVLQYPPDGPLIDVGSSIDDFIAVFNAEGSDALRRARDGFVGWILVPFRDFFTSLPWLPLTLLAGWAGHVLVSLRVGLICAALLAGLALLGLWDKAMLSLYLVSLSLIASFAIGLPAGILLGLNRRAYAAMEVCADIIQTLPSFIYLIPVVILFGAGDFPAFLAIVAYLVAPIIRYNAHAVKQVAFGDFDEVAEISGCGFTQRLFLVYLPIAAPQILLGINQAIMLGFGMLVITALVGSRGLEETTLVAIAQVKPGIGLLAGLGIAALAIVMDRLLRGASRRVG